MEGIGSLGTKHTLTANIDGFAYILARDVAVLIDGELGSTLTFDVLLLTRLGREVMSLLAVPDERSIARDLVQNGTKGSNLRKISLGRFTPQQAGITFQSEEVLWEAPAS